MISTTDNLSQQSRKLVKRSRRSGGALLAGEDGEGTQPGSDDGVLPVEGGEVDLQATPSKTGGGGSPGSE